MLGLDDDGIAVWEPAWDSEGFPSFGGTSPSARILSRRASTPATACCSSEPHLDDFAGAVMVL